MGTFLFSTVRPRQPSRTPKNSPFTSGGSQMVENVPFCLELACNVQTEAGREGGGSVVNGASSILVSAVFYGLEKGEWGMAVHFVPSHIVAGRRLIDSLVLFLQYTSHEQPGKYPPTPLFDSPCKECGVASFSIFPSWVLLRTLTHLTDPSLL